MKVSFLALGCSVALLAAASASAASAETIYVGPTGLLPTDTSQTFSFDSATAGDTPLSFTINGYETLDGQNYYEDVFSLRLNGHTIFVGTFNLGGGSNSGEQANVYYNPYGATFYNPTHNGTAIGRLGGTEVVEFSDVLPVNAGPNSLEFKYYSLTKNHAGFQGTGDEGWGLTNVSTAAPEPSTWAMLVLGFAGLGFAGYRRSAKRSSAAAVA